MKDCLIIGAGISGLMAARTLIGKGINVTIIDKSAGVGGRMATRRIGDGVFDHGAQFFTVRSDTLRKYVTSWEERGIVHEWCRGFLPGKPEGHARYIGTSGMTGIAKFLAADLDLRLNQRALFVSERNRKWHVLTDRDETIEADALILTPPVPQSLALIQTAELVSQSDIEHEIGTIIYNRCLAVLVTMEPDQILARPGGLQLSGEPLLWIADNRMKGISPDVTAVTIHAGPEFSRKYWNMDDSGVAQNILHTAAGWLKGKHITWQVKRWLYSQPRIIYDERFYAVSEPAPLIFAGDAFGGPMIEGAVLSGISAAQYLLNDNA